MQILNIKNKAHIRQLFSHPDEFFLKFKKRFIIDAPTRRFIEHNKKVWNGWDDPAAEGIVLVSWDEILMWNMVIMYLANVLAKKNKAKIYTFAFQKFPLARALRAVYRSLNVKGHVDMGELNPTQKTLVDEIYNENIKLLKSKEDVFHLKIHGIHVGVDIYETYLKELNKPTVVFDKALSSVLRKAIEYLIFWEDYFEQHKVIGVIVSHDSYLNYNIACKIAYKKEIPVYTPVGFSFGLLKQPYDSYGFFYSYRAWFADLSEQEKKEAKELAKRQLDKRLSGEIGGDLYYVLDSAFHSQSDPVKVTRSSERIKVLICSHCFYDNPQGYGGMLFVDFYEWLKFLVQIAEKTDYDWYLKTHPNPLPGTLENIKEILGNSSRITVVPSSTSHHQLVQEGIKFVFTVYGTVGHEYPLSGVQVINAGYNPHVGYNFTWTPKSLKEYEWFILNLKDLKKNIQREEIYEFYYMHYYYRVVKDLVFNSFHDIYKHLNTEQRSNSDIYSYFLDNWSEQRHQESIRRFEDFIDSGKQYQFARGPVDAKVFQPQDTEYLT